MLEAIVVTRNAHRGDPPCPDCELARDLERHARLIALGLEDARAVELAALPPEEREAAMMHLLELAGEATMS